MNINSKLKELEPNYIRHVLAKSQEIEGSINLTIGEPDLKTARIVLEKSAKYMLETQLCYSPLGGVVEFREEIAKFYNNQYGSSYDRDNVLVTVGSTEGISTALRGILNPEDEVIVVKPAYPLYGGLITLSGAKIVYVDSTENGYKVSADILEGAITPKTKAIILNYPSNPCGTILSEEEVEKISRLAVEKDIYLISDEIYSELIFSGNKFYSPAAVKEVRDNLIVVNGFSKSHSMTGWRVGYILANKTLRNHLLKISQYTISTPSTLSQYGGLVALKEDINLEDNLRKYEERALYIYNLLKKIGFEVVKPEGTFYVLADYSKLSSLNSLDFSMKLLEDTGVAVVPGKSFGVENCIRISCTQELEVLEEAGKKLEEYFKG
ncbi:pyridoxal phosphate-dependent aminotransferase [Propionigenium maris]|nr:aminotransferase class I/II-fold pyridoxal phosphate-dependent enzyme [Propionigenium maris]